MIIWIVWRGSSLTHKFAEFDFSVSVHVAQLENGFDL
jgi:hypothetical protein